MKSSPSARSWFGRQLRPWLARISGSPVRAARPSAIGARFRRRRELEAFTTSRLPVLGDGVTVLACDGRRSSLWRIERTRPSVGEPAPDVRVAGVASSDAAPSPAVWRGLLDRLGAVSRDAIVVASDVELAVRYAGDEAPGAVDGFDRDRARGWVAERDRPGATGRSVVASMRRRDRARWVATLEELGLRFEGAYPLLGSALAGLRLGSEPVPRLVLQLEAGGIAVLEACGESCRAVGVLDGPPTLDRCIERVGVGCPEVWLTGDGVDLSEYGYELVRGGRTWVHLPAVRAIGAPPGASGTWRGAAVVGAARHALGLGAVDTTACVPPAIRPNGTARSL